MAAEYDVIVVGAGPAGSSCAGLLSKKGVKTLLLDKASFPRDKTCGDEISEKCIEIIRELGAEEEIKKSQHSRIYGLAASSPSGTLIESRQSVFQQYICRREIFDNILFQLAKKKTDTVENFTVTDVIMDGNKVVGVKGVKDGKEQEFRAKVIVGADGANSVVAKKLGLSGFDAGKSHVAIRAYYENVDADPEQMQVHFLSECMPGYFWIFPVGDNVSNVGLGMLASEIQNRRLNLKLLFERAVKTSRLAPRFKNAKQVSEVKGWNLPTGAQKRKRAGDGFVLVGDAASIIDPLTGGGIGNAMISSKIAAGIIEEALKKNDLSYAMLKEYEKAVDKAFEKEFMERYTLMRLGQNKLVVDAAFEIMGEDEGIGDSVLKGMMAGGSLLKLRAKIYLRFLPRLAKNMLKNKIGGHHTTKVPAATHAP
ncbi:MAG: NAD(P)/FAD-dependent oxidoreductase [Candidatus Aenigmarchaeota archaeon]|nr:NAD(P)/FAD-dependent oxidoreductase [Candidatus Aenigmarchaeota archaeon]